MRWLKDTPSALAVVALALLVLAAALPSAAQEGMEGEMSPEQQAMMEAWMKAMTPGEPHARLARYEGDYTMTVKTWMDPTGDPEVTQGTARYEMIMDGRYLHETVDGTMMGTPFRGMGMTGYDNVKGKYWSTWVDNMSTGVLTAYGEWDEAVGGLVMHLDYADPVSGDTKKARTVSRLGDDGSIVFRWFETIEGNEVVTMEIVYQPAS